MKAVLVKLSKLEQDRFVKILPKVKIDTLKKIKEYLDDKYYNSGEDCELTDEKYDILKAFLEENDKDHEYSVGAKMRDDDNKVELPYWLGSLEAKIRPGEENKLKNWLAKNTADEFIIEEKLDGASCLYVHKDGKTNIYTRGKGGVGSDISHLLKYLKGIPSVEDDIAIRGELIMKKQTFEEKYSEDFANPRNMVSGLVNAKSFREGIYDIDFVVYEIITDDEFQIRQSKQLHKLKKLGFNVVKSKVVDSITTEVLTETLISFREKSKYEIDGIVVQPNKKYIRNTDKDPKYAIAYKINSDGVEAEVEAVEWNISKHKILKPRIKIKPIKLDGITINYATAFNSKFIVDNSLGQGSIIKIVRSGGVIPFITEVVKGSSEPDMPDVEYTWNESGVDIVVDDDENGISDIKLISSFFSGMDIKCISDAITTRLYNAGFDSLLKILHMKPEDFETIEGFKKTLSEKIYNNIHNGLQDVELYQVVGSSGMFGIGFGKRKMKALLTEIPNLFELYKKITEKELIEKINSIEGFSEISSAKIVNNLEKVNKFLKDINKFVTYKSEKVEKEKSELDLDGKSYLFSGFRDKEIEKEIEKRGGKIASSVSKNLSFLIVKDKEKGSTKIEKAEKLGVKILSLDEFKL